MDESSKAAWKSMVSDSKAHGEHNDCTVKALTAATGLSYAECHAALAKAGRPHRKGCVFMVAGKAAAASLGWNMEMLSNSNFRAKTMITAERDALFQRGRWVIQVSRHVAALIDGKVIDWSEGSRRRIQCAYRFTPIPGFVAPLPAMRDPLPTGSATWQSFRKYTKQDNFELF